MQTKRNIRQPLSRCQAWPSTPAHRPRNKPRTIIEPFRIKTVEPLRLTTREERTRCLEQAYWNLFKLKADDVLIDLLTDSGTGAMSAQQWAGMMRGDESYAGARSFFQFKKTVQDLTGFDIVIPTHQGRAAERILFQCLNVNGKIVLANTAFDTTRANAEAQGGRVIDIPIAEAKNPAIKSAFKGNMDIERLKQLLGGEEGEVAVVIMTVTNNTGGGQPVSMANIREASRLCKQAGVLFYLDSCRFAENAYFIKQREVGYEHRTIRSIVYEMFSLVDGATFSAKKDGLANIGGFILTRDADLSMKQEQLLILTEGYPTYGGLAGRDLEAIAVGLQEVVEEDYLQYRIASTKYLADGLERVGIPTVQPAGGHAVYIDASSFLPHIPPECFPGHTVACAFYLEGGVRSCETGTLMFGGPDPVTGEQRFAQLELCRMAMPRRVYTQSHIEYVLEVAEVVYASREELPGFRIIEQPKLLRHFTAKLMPTPIAQPVVDPTSTRDEMFPTALGQAYEM